MILLYVIAVVYTIGFFMSYIELLKKKIVEKRNKNTVYIDEEINSYENDTTTFD